MNTSVSETPGSPVPYGCLDLHHHVGMLAIGDDDLGGSPAGPAEVELRIAIMDRFGIDAAAVMPSLQYERPEGAQDMRAANDAAAAYRDAEPTRFPAAIGTVDPLVGTRSCLDELTRMSEELGLVGVTWHHRFQGLFAGDPRMEPLLARAAELGLTAYFHLFAESTMEAPWALEKWAERFPEHTFVALDAFTSFTQSRYLAAIGRRCPNIVFETAGTFPLGRVVQEFVAEFGAERVAFGSDLYTRPQTWDTPSTLLEIRAAESISEADRQLILVENARRLLGLA